MEITPITPIQYVKGVGEKRAALFAKLGITCVRDLIMHYPRQYEDWSAVTTIADAPIGEPCCIKAVALNVPAESKIRKGLSLYKFTVSDGVSGMKITLFNNKYAAAKVKAGTEYLLFGLVNDKMGRREMASPLMEPAETGERIRPIYPQTAGLTSRVLESTIARVLPMLNTYLDQDPLPPALRQQYALCTRRYALENIHFPTDSNALSVARKRLAFEELLILQLGLLRLRGRVRRQSGAVMQTDETEAFWKLLPFTPTGAQKRAVADCVRDMSGSCPMSRLVQGDVGSGKTAVAAAVAYHAVKNGWQTALMAPTEILAEQHYRSLSALLEKSGVRVGLLVGGMKVSQKRPVLKALENGELDLVIGTHALISDTVEFAKLGLVITDEQHRFGVAQRAKLAEKGVNPHMLVMSATPIPRTLALIVYGDLDISILDERPPGRQPIATYAVRSNKRERAYQYIKKFVAEGRQVYIVCPLVEDSETDLASATAYFEMLQNGPLSGISIGLLHGKMKSADKEAVMAAFSKGDISVLVSTTVIEVGVDVPNANLMVIENAERFGLAQLHQLRGRVGRGKHASTCILISDAQNEEAIRRLRVMCSTNDGFLIADEDLKQRGPGDFFGNRQHGLPDLRIADLSGDMPLFREAQQAAGAVIAEDPFLEKSEHAGLAEEIVRLFASVGEDGMN